MTCPPDLANILLEIIGLGVLQARAAGWSGDAARASAAADHVHNLPGLLQHYTPCGLDYYWVTERSAFLAHCPAEWARAFQPHWDQLQKHVERLNTPVAAQ